MPQDRELAPRVAPGSLRLFVVQAPPLPGQGHPRPTLRFDPPPGFQFDAHLFPIPDPGRPSLRLGGLCAARPSAMLLPVSVAPVEPLLVGPLPRGSGRLLHKRNPEFPFAAPPLAFLNGVPCPPAVLWDAVDFAAETMMGLAACSLVMAPRTNKPDSLALIGLVHMEQPSLPIPSRLLLRFEARSPRLTTTSAQPT